MDVEEAYTLVRKEEATELYLVQSLDFRRIGESQIIMCMPAPTTVSETKQNESGNESEPVW